MAPRTRPARICLLLVGLVGLTACGTTVTGAQLSSTGSGSGLSGGASAGQAIGGSTGQATLSAGGTVGGVDGAGGAQPGAVASSGGSFGSGAASGGQALSTASAPGITPTTIAIGLPYSVNGAAANEAIGGAGVTQGDERGELTAVINDVNSHGGVLGRKIVPIWHAVDALSDDTSDSQLEAICADFTQDHHVFAIMLGGDPIIERCAQRAGAVAVYENLSASSAQTFAKYPMYVEVSMMDLNRQLLNEAVSLGRQNYFAPWDSTASQPAAVGGQTKVGIIGFDTPDYHFAVDKTLQPELSRLGHAAASQDVVYLPVPQRTSDLSTMSAQEANAIVKFRQDGVEHVIIADVSGTLTLEFLNQAESQHYYPRYGWTSQNAPQLLAGAGDVQSDQLNGSMGIGFTPGIDLAAADNPDNGPYSNAAHRSCLSLLKAKGFTFADANAKTVGLLECSIIWFFRQAMSAISGTISQSSFIAAVNSLGASYQSPTTFGTFFGPAQHDGDAAYYDYFWNTGCSCMRYKGTAQKAIGEGES
jgi:hypothetical protein